MKQFADLLRQLSLLARAPEKTAALREYFRAAPDPDRVWALALLGGKAPRRLQAPALLLQWLESGQPLAGWLLERCYEHVGDRAKTLALLSPTDPAGDENESLQYYMNLITGLRKLDPLQQQEKILGCWKKMDADQRMLFYKLLSGQFRVKLSVSVQARALGELLQQEPGGIHLQLAGSWDPASHSFKQLTTGGDARAAGFPLPFSRGALLEAGPGSLGPAAGWQAYWQWAGLRVQLVTVAGDWQLWGEQQELLTSKFPEWRGLQNLLAPGAVVEGQLIAGSPGAAQPLSLLAARLSKKQVTPKKGSGTAAYFLATDLLRWEGRDLRNLPREQRLEMLLKALEPVQLPFIHPAEPIPFADWGELEVALHQARSLGAEGLALHPLEGGYGSAAGQEPDYWLLKPPALQVRAVLTYAGRNGGTGKREFSVALRDGDRLTGITRTEGDFSAEEIRQLEEFIKNNTLEKFGPVRTVKPELVFEISFESVIPSARHKAGLVLQGARISRWRKDLGPSQINSLQDLKALIPGGG